MRLAWRTDIHLNFLDPRQRRRFLNVVRQNADAVAVSGDIGESDSLEELLREMENVSRCGLPEFTLPEIGGGLSGPPE
jgi:hypothetical protein